VVYVVEEAARTHINIALNLRSTVIVKVRGASGWVRTVHNPVVNVKLPEQTSTLPYLSKHGYCKAAVEEDE